MQPFHPANFQVALSYFSIPKAPYENAFQQIDSKLHEILTLPEAKTVAARGENQHKTLAFLQEAYTLLVDELNKCANPEKPPMELAIRFCDVLRQYGQLIYTCELPNSFALARQIEFAALNAGDYAVGILNTMYNFSKDFEKLDDFRQIDVSKHLPLEFMDRHVLDHSPDFCAARPALGQLSAHALFVLAYTRRWLNGSCRNCENPDEPAQTRAQRYTNLIMTADRLLNMKLTQETKDELWELDYNDKPNYFKFMMEHDVTNQPKWKESYDSNWVELERLANHDDGKICRALNKMSFDIKDPKECEIQLRKAYERHPTKEGVHFSIVLNNLGHTLIQIKPPQIEEARALLSRAKKIADEHRQRGVDNVNFKTIDKNYAVICVDEQSLVEARRQYANALKMKELEIVTVMTEAALKKMNEGKIAECNILIEQAKAFAKEHNNAEAQLKIDLALRLIELEKVRMALENQLTATNEALSGQQRK